MEYQNAISVLNQCLIRPIDDKNMSDLVHEILVSIESNDCSDEDLLIMARKLICLKQLQPAKILLQSVSTQNQEQLQILALLAESFSSIGLFGEAEQILNLLLVEKGNEDTILSTIDALNKFIAGCIDNKYFEIALEKLEILNARLLNMNRVHHEQAELLALAGEFWMKMGKSKEAGSLWKKAVIIANQEFEKNKSVGRMRHAVRQTYDAIIISIAKSGGLDLAKQFVRSIADEISRKQAFETTLKYLSLNQP